MSKRSTILLKLTGEVLQSTDQKASINSLYVRELAKQIKAMQETHYFTLVVGGGNFFRGKKEGTALGMTPAASDSVGMLATLMNGAIIQDLFAQEGLDTGLFTAINCPSIALSLSHQALQLALQTKDCVVFSGGLGNPFFTTDTTSIVRALQVQAQEVWKITKVDGIYTDNPQTNPQAQRLPCLTYSEALERGLEIMDKTAFQLAREHNVIIRVFSLYEPQGLLRAANDPTFGSKIAP